MRDGWTETTLGDVVVLKPGKYIAKGSYVADGKYWIYGSNSVMGRYSEALVSKPHVVMAAIGAYAGAVRHSENPSWVNNNAFALIPNSQLLSSWLFYWLETCLEISSVVVGTGQPYVQRPALMNQVFRLPPIEEQRRIVDVVASVDAYIDALKDKVAKARTARNAVLHELLSAGGPNWTETTLGELLTLEYGRALKAEDRDGLGFPVFGSAGDVGMHSEPSVPTSPVIVVGRKGTAGAVHWSETPCSVIDTAYFARLKVSCSARFVFHLLSFVDLPALSAQTGVPGLNRDRAYGVSVALPPLEEQRRIVDIVSSMDEVISASEKAVAEAVRLRSGLLSDLLSGEHEIPASYDSLLGAA